MKRLSFIPFLFITALTYAQKWDSAHIPVFLPEGSATSAWGCIQKYDTPPCEYKLKGDTTIYRGYKLFFIKDCYYIDDQNTFNVFFDKRKKRVPNVSVYRITYINK